MALNQLKNTLESAIVDGELSLSKSLLKSFINVDDLDKILPIFISIQNASVNWIETSPADGSDVGGVEVAGSVTYLGVENIQLTLLLYQFGGIPQLRFTLSLADVDSAVPDKWVLGQVMSGLTTSMDLANPVVTLATSSDPDYNYGLNYESSIDLKNSNNDVFEFINKFFGIDTTTFTASVSPDLEAAMGLEMDLDIDLLNTSRFKLEMSRVEVEFELGSDGELTATIAADTTVQMKEFGGMWTTLVFTGQVSLEAESVTSAFTLSGAARTKKGGDSVEPTDVWVEPFGVSGVEIDQTAIQIGMTYAPCPPCLDNVGFAGGLRIGDVEGDFALLVDINDPDNFIIAGSINEITLIEMFTAICPPAMVAYYALPSATSRALNKVIDVTLRDMNLYIVPTAASIGAIDYAQGIAFGGKLDLWGWDAMLDVKVDPASGIVAYGELDPLNLLNVIKISGKDDDPKPILDLELSSADQRFFVSAEASILGASMGVMISAGEKGLLFDFDSKSGGVTTSLSCEFKGSYFYASGSYKFSLPDMSFKLKIDGINYGTIKLNGASIEASGELTVQSSNPNFKLKIDGKVKWNGTTYNMPTLTIKTKFSKIEKLIDKVGDHIEDKAADIFADLAGTLEEWGDAVADGVIDAGEDVGEIAKDGFNATVDAAIDVYDKLEVGYDTLVDAGYAAQDVANGLKRAGQTASQVAQVLDDSFGAQYNTIANLLSNAGFTDNQVADTLKNTYKQSAKAIAKTFKSIGKSTNSISKALKSVRFNSDTVGDALKGIGISSSDITKTLKSAGFSSNDISKTLKNMGVGRDDIAKYMKSAGYGADTIAKGLKHVGYGSKDVAKGLAKGAKFGKKTCKNALKSAGWSNKAANKAIDSIGNFFKNLF